LEDCEKGISNPECWKCGSKTTLKREETFVTFSTLSCTDCDQVVFISEDNGRYVAGLESALREIRPIADNMWGGEHIVDLCNAVLNRWGRR
jgi:hypothetical protein